MSKTLYDTGEMSIDGNRGRVIVVKTGKGIEVKRDSLYSDEPATIHFYQDGNYPELPQDWQAAINDYHITQADYWLNQLQGYEVDRRINPHARALGRKGGRKGGKSTSQAKSAAARANGRKGGRTRKTN